MEGLLKMPAMEGLIKKLHSVGEHYWTHPESSDCTIVVLVAPIHSRSRRPETPAGSGMQRQTSTSSVVSTGTLLSRQFDELSCAIQRQHPDLNPSPILSIPTRTDTEERKGVVQKGSRRSSEFGSLPAGADFCGQSSIANTPSTSASSVWSQRSGTDHKEHVTGAIPLQVVINGARRESAPACAGNIETHVAPLQEETRHTFRLHSDFLITQSSMLRKFLGGSTTLGLETGNSMFTTKRDAEPFSWTKQSARLLSRPLGHNPVLQLSLPADVSSFVVLIEYLYLGDFERLTRAMESGEVRWERVMLNAQYLGLDDGLKQKLGSWWSTWSAERSLAARKASSTTTAEVRYSKFDSSAPPSPKSTDTSMRRHASATGRGGDWRDIKRTRLSDIIVPRHREAFSDQRQLEGSQLGQETCHRKRSSLSDLGSHTFYDLRPVPAPLSPAKLSPSTSPSLNSKRTGSSAVRDWLGKTRRPPSTSSLAYYCNSPAVQQARGQVP